MNLLGTDLTLRQWLYGHDNLSGNNENLHYHHGNYHYYINCNQAVIHNDQITITIEHPLAGYETTQLIIEIRYPIVIKGEIVITSSLAIESLMLVVNTGLLIRTIRYCNDSLTIEADSVIKQIGYYRHLERMFATVDYLLGWITDLI